MEQISITFTSNTGLLMQYGDTKVLFDSLYGKSGHRFSPLPQVLEQEIIEGLKSFFGLEHTVKLKVKVNTLSKDDSPKRQRVI